MVVLSQHQLCNESILPLKNLGNAKPKSVPEDVLVRLAELYRKVLCCQCPEHSAGPLLLH